MSNRSSLNKISHQFSSNMIIFGRLTLLFFLLLLTVRISYSTIYSPKAILLTENANEIKVLFCVPVCDPLRTWQFSDCFVPAPVGGLQVLASPNEEGMQEDGGENISMPKYSIYCYTDNSHRQYFSTFNTFPLGISWNIVIKAKYLYFSLTVYGIYLPSEYSDFVAIIAFTTCFSEEERISNVSDNKQIWSISIFSWAYITELAIGMQLLSPANTILKHIYCHSF